MDKIGMMEVAAEHLDNQIREQQKKLSIMRANIEILRNSQFQNVATELIKLTEMFSATQVTEENDIYYRSRFFYLRIVRDGANLEYRFYVEDRAPVHYGKNLALSDENTAVTAVTEYFTIKKLMKKYEIKNKTKGGPHGFLVYLG